MREIYSVSTDKSLLDISMIHEFLSTKAYWCLDIPKALVIKSIEQSMCFGVYAGGSQVGFARIITDYATMAYLCDVFVIESHRGLGLSKLLVHTIMDHPDLQGLRRWMLVTRDAHGLYRNFGWNEVADASRYMEIRSIVPYADINNEVE